MGGTMRLGADPVKLHDGTRAREMYDEPVIYERHRHRYEVNNHLRRRLEHAGLVCSGTSPDDRLVEVVELPDHPFFVASQFHPEFKSRPLRPAAAVPGVRPRRPRAGARACSGGRAGGALGRRPGRSCRLTAQRAPRRASGSSSWPTSCGSARSRARRAASATLADAVTAQLRELGLEVDEDGPEAETGSDAGNLLARLPGPEGSRTILLCAHLDTVPLDAPVDVACGGRRAPQPQRGDPRRRQQGGGGHDRRAAARGSRARARPSESSCCSRPARSSRCAGAKAFDRGAPALRVRLRVRPRLADRGADRRRAHLLPRRRQLPRAAAHAGIRPEAGRNAIAAAARAVASMRPRPPRPRDDRQRRADRGRHGGQRRGGALPSGARGPQPRRRPGR